MATKLPPLPKLPKPAARNLAAVKKPKTKPASVRTPAPGEPAASKAKLALVKPAPRKRAPSQSAKVGTLTVQARIAASLTSASMGKQLRLTQEQRVEMMDHYVIQTLKRVAYADWLEKLHPRSIAAGTGVTVGLVNKYYGGVHGARQRALELTKEHVPTKLARLEKVIFGAK